MKFRGVSVKTPQKFKFSMAHVYSNHEWQQANCFIFHNNEWVPIGAACTQMLWYQDTDGNQLYTNGKPYLVRESWNTDTTNGIGLLDVTDAFLIDSNNLMLTAGGSVI